MAEQVGGLYVTVGVNADKAIAQAKLLNEQLYAIAKHIGKLNSSTSLDGLVKQLQKVNAEAAKIGQSGSSGKAAAGKTPDPMAAIQAQAIAENERRKAMEATGVAAQRAAAAQAKAAADAQKAQERAARQSMASMQKEALEMNRAFDAEKRAAEKAALTQVEAQKKAAQARELAMLKEAHAMNKVFDQEARAAEKAAAREIRAAEAAAVSRRGATKRASGDIASAGAAAFSGNSAYALANLAQAGIKLTGVFEGVGAGALVAGGAIATLVAAAPVAGVALTAVGTKIAEAGVAQAQQLEMLQIQYEGLLGSAAKAKQEVDYVLQMGTESLVPTQDLMDANRLLLAFGANNTAMRHQMLEFMSAFATVTGASQMQLNNLSYAMGQIVSVGKVNAIDLRQLATAGISTEYIYQQVAKQQKISVAEAKNWMTQGKLTADVVLPAILAKTKDLDEAQKKARDSAQGILANIKDIANVKMAGAFTGLANSLKPLLEWVQEFIRAFDFEYIGKAFQQVVGYFHEAFAGMGMDASNTSQGISETIGKAVNVVGYVAVRIAQMVVAVFDTVMVAVNVLWMAIQGAVAAILKSVSVITGAAGAIPGPWQDSMKDVSTSTDNAAAAAANGAGIAAGAWVSGAAAAGKAWSNFYTQVPIFREPNKDMYATGSPTATAWGNFYHPQTVEPLKYPKPISLPTGTGGSSGGGVDPMIAKMKKLIDLWKQLIELSIQGRDALREAFNVPFEKAIRQGGGNPINAATEAFTSGEIDTIVSQYKELKKALEDYYALAEAKGPKANRKAMTAQRREDVAFLKQMTGELVRLAAERAQMEKALADAEEAYNKQVEAIQKSRAAQQKQYTAQQKLIAQQYDDYYVASSATTGRFVKGAINVAQEALDAATIAYDEAKAKLDDLQAARDDFMSTLKQMAWSFVNDLSKVNQEITRFTRLDSIGSFSSVTEQIASTESFTKGLKDRLAALKDFAANVKTLQARGLDASLLQQILQAGPEQSGALAKALAGASASEIADINKVQADLAGTITGMQTDASAAWFDAGIAAQEAFTSPLKAAMDAAQKQVTDLTASKDLALGILEAWNTDQNAMYDEQEAAALAHYQQVQDNMVAAMRMNQQRAQLIADQIDERLSKLPDSAYAQGLDVLQGLIDGISDDAKLKELKAAVASMARMIKNTVNETLGINSPSKVMIESGYAVGQGLAVGMGLSEPLVSEASGSMARAAIGTLGSDGAAMGGGDTYVKVFIGDQELRDIVDYQVSQADAANGSFVLTGRRL